MRRMGSESTINIIDVPNIDEFIENIVKAGGKVVAPKMAVPGVGYAAYCEDTEGNQFGLMQDDPSAGYELKIENERLQSTYIIA